MLIQPSLNRSKSSPLFLPFSRAGEAEKAKPLLFYALIQRLMAPIYQYINMLTGFLDKKFILSPASVNSLSCFIHEPAWHWESSATVKKNRLAKGLCLFLKVFDFTASPPFLLFSGSCGLELWMETCSRLFLLGTGGAPSGSERSGLWLGLSRGSFAPANPCPAPL